MTDQRVFITNIQRFSLDDGPGIRTTVFFAGCNMKCLWCHNPENLEIRMLAFDEIKCSNCGRCKLACHGNVHVITENGHRIRREQCKKCLKCIEACDYQALYSNSYEISVEDMLAQIERDRRFYLKSSGGVTFSGGEPVLQTEGLQDILLKCKGKGIHTAIETAGNYPFHLLEPLLESIDLVIMDCKTFSAELHKKCTGSSNEKILDNIQTLSEIKKRLWVRIPVIWDVNITLNEIEKIAGFLAGKQIEKVELIPYHQMGISKYQLYGLKYSIGDKGIPTKEQLEDCYRIMRAYKLSL